jgi:hypothetical protein
MDMTDLEKKEYPTFKQLSNLYKKYFTLGYINADINLKFALISLIGYIVNELKKKKPDVTYYSVIMKMAEGSGLPEELLLALSIICEDFAYQCTEFPTFGMKPPQMVAKIKEILNMYVPF